MRALFPQSARKLLIDRGNSWGNLSLRGRFKKCFSPFAASWTAPCDSGWSESLPGRFRTDEPLTPLQGTHNNPAENAIRPIALGRKNWLFAGSETAGQRSAAIMSLLATAKANGHEPHAWLTDVLTRLPTTLDRDIDSLLPHLWKPVA